MSRPDVEAMATEVVLIVKTALMPVLERLASAEARLTVLGDLRDRVVTVETKTALPVPTIDVEAALSPVRDRIAAAELRVEMKAAETTPILAAVADLRDRLVTVETKAAIPPPAVTETPVDLTPVLTRLHAAESALEVIKAEGVWHSGLEPKLADLRDRVVVMETKAALPAPLIDLDAALAPLRDRIAAAEQDETKDAIRLEGYTSFLQRDLSVVSERLAVFEARPILPGPPGEPGPPGKDGADGKDGTAGLSFEGVYQEGKSYEFGHLVTWAGSSWHCNEPTTTKPGDGSKAWTLMVKRGRDGRDGQDAPGLIPVVSVGRR